MEAVMSNKPFKRARRAAYDVLSRVFAGDAYADILLQKELERVEEGDRPLAFELAYGVLRWQIRIDFVINAFSSIKTKKLEHGVLNALRIGAYQLLFLSGIPSSAAVNESVNLIKASGAQKAGFVNAVLRSIDRERDAVVFPDIKDEPQRHVSIVYSHPEWMVRRWIARYGLSDAVELCKTNQTRPGKLIRANTLVTSRDALLKWLEEAGFKVQKAAFSPDGIEVALDAKAAAKTLSPADPRFYIQDEASQLIARLLAPAPGETVLDACAAPGGKATHIAALMKNTGAVFAVDKYPGRLKSLMQAARRCEARIVKALAADASRPLPFKGSASGGFDAILLDAPCSGLGVIRRSPDIKIRRIETDIAALARRQSALLDNLSSYVKKGGRMVYSVCTIEPEETDDIVNAFLKAHPDFSLEHASQYLPPACKPCQGCNPLVDENGFLRTLPHKHGMDGFFAARLERHAGKEA